MSIGKQTPLGKGKTIRSSGFIVGLDTHLWRLQIPFWMVISNEYMEKIVECMRGIIEKRTMEGIDYNGKPFAKYHNKREDEGEPVRHWPYIYRSHDLAKLYVARQREWKRRPSAQVHNTSFSEKGDFTKKKSGDKVTLHQKNEFGGGCWEWDFDPFNRSEQWAYGVDMTKGKNTDGVFYFYPWMFNREKRRRGPRPHKPIILSKKEEMGRLNLPLRERLNKAQKSKKRKYRNPTRNHPLWVLNFGRATEKQAGRYPAMVEKWEEKIKRMEDRHANPYVFWGLEREKLSPDAAKSTLEELKASPKGKSRQIRSLSQAINEWKKWEKDYPERLEYNKQKLENIKHKMQRMKETSIKIPARRWCGFTNQEVNQVIDSITNLFTGVAKSYENNMVKSAEEAANNVNNLQLIPRDLKGNILNGTLTYNEMKKATEMRAQGAVEYYRDADKCFEEWFGNLERLAGKAYQNFSGKAIPFSHTKQQITLQDLWQEVLIAEEQTIEDIWNK